MSTGVLDPGPTRTRKWLWLLSTQLSCNLQGHLLLAFLCCIDPLTKPILYFRPSKRIQIWLKFWKKAGRTSLILRLFAICQCHMSRFSSSLVRPPWAITENPLCISSMLRHSPAFGLRERNMRLERHSSRWSLILSSIGPVGHRNNKRGLDESLSEVTGYFVVLSVTRQLSLTTAMSWTRFAKFRFSSSFMTRRVRALRQFSIQGSPSSTRHSLRTSSLPL